MIHGPNNIAVATAAVAISDIPQRHRSSLNFSQQHYDLSSTRASNPTAKNNASTLKCTISRPLLRHSIYCLVVYACTSTCAAGIPSWRAGQFGGGTTNGNDGGKHNRLAFISSSGGRHDGRSTSTTVRERRRLVLQRQGSGTVSAPFPLPPILSQSRLFSSPSEKDSPPTKGKRGRKPLSEGGDEAEWEILVSAFQMYKAAYGDLKVPSRFVVPAMPPWPELAWGLKLGQRVATIRSTKRFVEHDPSRRATLDSLGFLWRLRSQTSDKNISDVSFDQIYDALACYRSEIQPIGPLAVPASFVVPDTEPWPKGARGMTLGKKMPNIRRAEYLDTNEGSRERLKGIGFQFDGKAAANDARFNAVYNALVRYMELKGDLFVPQSFVVPTSGEVVEDGTGREWDAKEWAEEMWGLKLGARVTAIRNQGTFVKNNPERKQMLADLGFEFNLSQEGKKRGRKRKVDLVVEEEEEEEQQLQLPQTDEANGTVATPPSTEEESIPFDDDNNEQPPASSDPSLFGTSAPAPTFDEDFFSHQRRRETGPHMGIRGRGGGTVGSFAAAGIGGGVYASEDS